MLPSTHCHNINAFPALLSQCNRDTTMLQWQCNAAIWPKTFVGKKGVKCVNIVVETSEDEMIIISLLSWLRMETYECWSSSRYHLISIIIDYSVLDTKYSRGLHMWSFSVKTLHVKFFLWIFLVMLFQWCKVCFLLFLTTWFMGICVSYLGPCFGARISESILGLCHLPPQMEN